MPLKLKDQGLERRRLLRS